MSPVLTLPMFNRRSTSDKRSEEIAMRSKKRLISWFIAFIMVTSIFGFILADQGGQNNDLSYNNLKVEQTKEGYYITHLNKTISLITYDHPISVESVKIDRAAISLLKSARVVGVTYNQSDERADIFGQAQYLIEKNLYSASRLFVQRGLFDASNTTLQSMTCNDTSPAMPVIVLRIGDLTGVFLQDRCIIVQGISSSDLLRASDRVVLTVAGVINNR